MLRASLRSVSGPSRRHVCLSCIARHGAPILRQFHYLPALRVHTSESKPENESFDASNEPPFQVPRNDQTPEKKHADIPGKKQSMDLATWDGLTQSQKLQWMRTNEHEYKRFRNQHRSPERRRLAPRHTEMQARSWWMKQKSKGRESAESGEPQSEPAKSEAPSEAQSEAASEVPSEAPQSEKEEFLKTWQSKSKSKVGKNAQLAHTKLLAAREGSETKQARAARLKGLAERQAARKEKEARLEAARALNSEKAAIPEVEVDVGTSESKSQPQPEISTDSAAESAGSEKLATDAPEGSETTSPTEPSKTKKASKKAAKIPQDSGCLSADKHSLQPIDAPMSPVPNVSFGLDRVLFNPGVYQLRDYRSRVYNFDPYLDKIMPVSEFDFDTLKPYITSSKDVIALEMAAKQKKKYYGSSSSMTSVLSHFHFLLSAWRPIDTRRLSQGFSDNLRSYTRLLRAPTAMFLHYKEKEGVYAIDADKEYDSANILMNLGKSMEKLLTLPKQEFERYRRTSQNKITPEEEETVPESYHYTGLGKFLMRSQLDAYDPRLPGTGMFDLKTRAVVSIRMDAMNHERGMGYEIKSRYGLFESFEREYFDMIRSAFLKYSLQVRVGRMDGIFVAYHNIERIFGFQYISLPEMDQCLHGQSATNLGDREFILSLGLWEKIMDKATKKFPKKSLRFHFETRDGKEPYMYIIAQPVTDEEIHAIQTKNQDEIEAIQKKLFNPDPEQKTEAGKESSDVDSDKPVADPIMDSEYDKHSAGQEAEIDIDAEGESDLDAEPSAEHEVEIESELDPETPAEIDLDAETHESEGIELEEYLENMSKKSSTSPETEVDTPAEQDEYFEDLLAMTLKITNKVNGEPVERPNRLGAQDKWTVDYELDEMDVKRGNDILRMCKRRRRLIFERSEDEEGVNSRNKEYLARLQKMAKQGRMHRQKERRKDRQQGIVVYEDLSGSGNWKKEKGKGPNKKVKG
ncbi:uncharacterized protein N7515_004103 [Penicillium bovifimosum]|uniref:Uncharacterized protein n=1 Tax=Penicillium bovifimosum TaxID=126998 RepID=A0A9W9H5X4_9EURO|nr:uncharacterized protein N7515_004103 [Penicillium bovifimosum]KAJ5139255.1 hypothetical protein N7515_004103 [Penicillium bovifimosum]